MNNNTCKTAECERKTLARGMCPTHYSLWFREENAERNTFTCVHCGTKFKTWRAKQGSCTPQCQSKGALHAARAKKNFKTKEIVPYQRSRTWAGTHEVGSTWTMGPCQQCGTSFVAPGDRAYCSDLCYRRAKWHRRYLRKGKFTVPDALRARIYLRDNHTCQLCDEAVDVTLEYTHLRSATLDHIMPQSLSEVPDHSESNLRLAHRICNSARGNKISA